MGRIALEHPHVSLGPGNQLLRASVKQELSPMNDNETVTHRLHILNNVGGQQNQFIFGLLCK